MSFEATRWAMRAAKDLSATERFVLSMLCTHADRFTLESRVSQSELAEECGYGRTTINATLTSLKSKGLIVSFGTKYKINMNTPVQNLNTLDSSKSEQECSETEQCSKSEQVQAVQNLNTDVQKVNTPVQNLNTIKSNKSNQVSIKKIEKKEPIFSRDEIEEFQSLYPHRQSGSRMVKQSVKEIETAFGKARKDTPQEVIIGGLEKAKAAWDNPKYIPEMTTWLNQRRWEREFANVSTTNASNTNPTSNQIGSNGRAQQQSRTALDFLADRARRDFGNQSEAMPPRDADDGSTLDFSRNSEGRYGVDRRV